MSTSETPATEVPKTETTAEEVTPVVAPEAAILSKDPQVVEENLAKAEPVAIPTEATTDAPAESAPAATTTEEPAAPAAAEHKEGSTILNIFKKYIPNPKTVEKKPKTEGEAAPASTSEAAATEPAEEKPFEGGDVEFKTHGGIFGGGYKKRTLIFGKEDGYSKEALTLFFAAHKVASYVGNTERTTAAWENAAHANVTGTGLLFLVKAKALDIPLSIINLADIESVTTNFGHFTIKTHKSGEYEFNAGASAKAVQWKAELEKRAEQAKLVVPAIHEREEYKTALATYQEAKGKHEAVTSDEEGEEGRRPTNWARRISGSFQRVMNPSKEADVKKETTAAKEAAATEGSEAAAATTEAAVVVPEVAVTEPAPAEAATTEAAPEKKEKRRSLSFPTGLFKGKQSKESSPEPTSVPTTTEETPGEEATTAAETTTPAVTEDAAAATEETSAAPAEATTPTEKSKRQSFFSGLLPKKEKSSVPPATTNGETTETTTEAAAAPTTEVASATTEEKETTPAPSPKKSDKGSLSRRLSSQIKSSFGRSKSPDKGKASAKVSDEAPKITTPIESTPENAGEAPVKEEAAPTAAAAAEEPMTTTEVPATTTAVDAPAESASTPVVSTQA